MQKLLYLTFPLFIISVFSFAGPGGPKKCKCDEDAVANRETKDENWNKNIHDACAAIMNKDYESAYTSLENALKIGDDSYIRGLYNCAKELKGTAAAVETKSETPSAKSEPEPSNTATEAKKETPAPKEEKPSQPAPKETETKASPPIVVDEPVTKEKPRVFTAEELASFQAKGMIKVNTFKDYLNKIGNKATSLSEGSDAINNALKLFYGTTYVQVSSINKDTKPKFPTRVYLERVKALKYDRVEIEWADCQYTSDLRKAPDGNYYGYIKFRQRFRGIKDGRVVYEDVTDKTIAVVLKAYDKAIEGEKVENFDIFLGDIEVLQTMKN